MKENLVTDRKSRHTVSCFLIAISVEVLITILILTWYTETLIDEVVGLTKMSVYTVTTIWYGNVVNHF